MGWEWEVEIWVIPEGKESYEWVPVYQGKDEREAVDRMRKAGKDREAGCIRLVWRP